MSILCDKHSGNLGLRIISRGLTANERGYELTTWLTAHWFVFCSSADPFLFA